ncbi:toprim domain-containing protein [Methylomonas sp. EFPC1]|uniref:toprim domain-containing protein n=1 Tax=Methylomonas sp. EFPC1 TaxID=2812647 RepID=UPI001968885F|nr:toprim domain-containing protein [Methylomonas sp. EFPC1]QSB02001.1 toprim domain-containing protein [Methylomonas sp. EFPC1]
MIDRINPKIIARLQAPPYNMKHRGEHLREGVCPSCGKKTLWTWVASPGVIQCNRTTNCLGPNLGGYTATSKDLFPDLFENLNKKYPATPENPNQTADAYLAMIRGFDLDKIKGWYSQGKYWHPHADKGTATVKFYLDDKHEVMWERLIDDVTLTDEDGSKETRNKNFKGAFKGLWWQPPGLVINPGDHVYLCEGILDAIALNLNGRKACAIMSSGTFPSEAIKPHLGRDVKWIIALDNDATGRRCLQKHAEKLRALKETVGAAISSETEEKADWNDLHKLKKLTDADFAEYHHLGDIELAQNYIKRAQVMWEYDPRKTYFVFTFGNSTYSFKIDPNEYEKACTKEHEHDPLKAEDRAFTHASQIKPIATFRMDFLYFQQPENGEDGQYFFRFNFQNHAPEIQLPFPGKTFGAAGDFKKAAMQKAPGAQFTGTGPDLDYLYKYWMGKIPKIVTTLDYVGYDRATGAYVFPDFAVQGGKILQVNKESFFQLKQGGIKTTVDIKQKLSTKAPVDWLNDYQTAFGVRGLVTLAWWFGCLFVEQVRDNHRSYPFLEVVGEAGSGKSDMVDFLWKLLGREGESFNPNSSTLAGRTRKMAEVSNLPVVFNETDNEKLAEDRHQKQFNWDEQKDLFDGEFGRVTGQKTQDNSTRKPTFKSGLMIVQNVPVVASEAIMTRICHLTFDRSHHSMDGKHASDRLNMLDVDAVSGFLLHSVAKAEAVMKQFTESFKKHRLTLQQNPGIKLQRIVENHAKIMAFADCLKLAAPITDAAVAKVHATLVDMAVERQSSLNEDHPIVQQFWALFDYLNSRAKPPEADDDIPGTVSMQHLLNHASHPEQEIAVNLEHFRAVCADRKLETIDSKDLRRWLVTSRKRQYLGNEVIRSRIEGRSVRVWRFKV